MVSLILLAAAAASQPSSESLRLARELAERGMLVKILPTLKDQQVNRVMEEAKNLSPDEHQRLQTIADRVFVEETERLLKATAEEYAKRLSVADLRTLVAFYRNPASTHFEAILPDVVAATAAKVGELDFEGDVKKAYCAETGRLCGTK